MNTLRTILYFDWLQLKRSVSFWLLTILLVVVGIYALYYGKAQVEDQKQKIILLQNAIDSSNSAFHRSLFISDTTALEAAQQTGMLFVNYPKPLALLSFGQRDIHKFALNLASFSFFYDKYSTGYNNKTLSAEIVNPMKLLAGNLDLSFVLIFLMPLYFILLAYNILSSEKENGTLSLLTVQGTTIKFIVIARLLMRWLIVVLLGFLLIVAGAIIARSDIIDVIYFFLIFFCYTICWAGIIIFFCRNLSSVKNALMLVTAWLAICFIFPALYNSILNQQYPIDAKTALTASIQKAESEAYPMPDRKKLDSFLMFQPQFRKGNIKDLNGWHDPRWYSCTYGIMDHYSEPFENIHQRAWAKRIHAANKWNYGSPALLAQYAFNQIAGSNAEQMQNFDTLAYKGFLERANYFNSLFFLTNNRFTEKQFQEIPVIYDFNPVIETKSFLLPAFIMFFMGVLLLFMIIENKRSFL